MPHHTYICVSDEESVKANSEAGFSLDTFAYISYHTPLSMLLLESADYRKYRDASTVSKSVAS